MRLRLLELVRPEVPVAAIHRRPGRPDLALPRDPEPGTVVGQAVRRDAARTEIGEIGGGAQAVAGRLDEMEMPTPVPVEAVPVLHRRQASPGPPVHRLALRAVVAVEPAGRGEVTAHSLGDGMHAVAEELEAVGAGLPDAGRGLGIADVAHRPVGSHGFSAHVERQRRRIHGPGPVVRHAGPERAHPARQRAGVGQGSAFTGRELQGAQKERCLVDRAPVRVDLHGHAPRAVAGSVALYRHRGEATVVHDPERLQRDRLPRESRALPVDAEISGGQRVVQMPDHERMVAFAQREHRGLFRGAVLAVPGQHVPTIQFEAIAAVDLDAENVDAIGRHPQQSLEHDRIAVAAAFPHAEVEAARQTPPNGRPHPDFIQHQPGVPLVGILAGRAEVVLLPLGVLVKDLVGQSRQRPGGGRGRCGSVHHRGRHHGRGRGLIEDVGHGQPDRGRFHVRRDEHVAERRHPNFLDHLRAAAAARVVEDLDPAREGRRSGRWNVPGNGDLATRRNRPHVRDLRLVESGQVRLPRRERVLRVARERGPVELPRQQVGPLRVLDRHILVVTLGQLVHHDVLGLVDRDGVRLLPLAVLAAVAEAAVERPDCLFTPQRLEEAAVSGERRRRDRQPGHTDEVPPAVGVILDPAGDEGVTAPDRLPDPREHRVPALAANEWPDLTAQRAAATLAAIFVLDEQIRGDIGESHRRTRCIAAPERPDRARPEQALARLVGIRRLARTVRQEAGEPGVKADVVRLGVEARVPVREVGARGPPRPAQVHHHDVGAVRDVLGIPGAVRGRA